jgi:YD repeat-containing protein
VVPHFTLNTNNTNHLKGFTVITPEGTRYEFGDIGDGSPAIEYTQSDGGNYGKIPAGWYLKKIESPDAQFAINFEYENEWYSFRFGLSDYNQCGAPSPPPTMVTLTEGKRLYTITTTPALETVTFTYGEIREDLDSHPIFGSDARELSEISLATGSFSKKYVFDYDYFIDNSQYAIPYGTGSENKRLKLLSIQEKSGDGNIDIPAYAFEYFSKEGSPDYLPQRLSRAIDHWGFYNGADGNNDNYSLNIPLTKGTFINGTDCNTYQMIYPGKSDRESDETAMKYGTLKKITYPTGGHTEFAYEANDYYTTEIQETVETFVEVNHAFPYPGQCNTSETPGSPSSVFFTASQLPDIEFYYEIRPSAVCNCDNGNIQVSIEIKAVAGTTTLSSGQVNMYPCETGDVQTATGYLTDLFPDLQADVDYSFSILGTNCAAYFNLTKTTVSNVPVNKKVGGLRVKQVTTNDGITSSRDIVRTYDYDNTPGQSSGKLFNQPRYWYGVTYYSCPADSCGVQCNCPWYPGVWYHHGGGGGVYFFDNSVVPLGSFEGYHIGYEKVKENFAGNGYKVFTYYTDTPVCFPPGSCYEYPVPPEPARILSGNLHEAITYDEQGAEVARETHIPHLDYYVYSTGNIYKIQPISCESPPYVTKYTVRTRPYREDQVTKTLDGVVTSQTFEYNSSNYLFPTEESFINSDGKATKTNTSYTYNLAYECLRDELRDRYMVGISTSNRVYVDDVLVSGDSTRWTNFNATIGTPASTCTGDANNPNTPYPWKFYSYEVALDEDGNPLAPGAWVEKGEISERYMDNGLPKTFLLRPQATPGTDGWAPEYYEWAANGLIKKRTYAEFEWEYDYYPDTRLLKSFTDIDDQEVGFTYDQLMRLETISAREGKVLTTYTYNYGLPKEWQGGNWIRTFIDYDGFEDQDTYAYFDGLGRPLDTWRIGYGPLGEDIVAEKIFYDNQGRPARNSYMPDIQGALPYTSFTYEPSPLNRLIKETYPDGQSVQTDYGSAGQYYLNTITDENSHATSTLTDILGRKTEVQDAIGNSTYFRYDNKNNLVKVVNPENQEYLYTYDQRNRLMTKKVPGADCQNFFYNDRDLLMASRDGNLYYGDVPGQTLNRWLVNEYDIYGRVERVGFDNGNSQAQLPPCSTQLTTPDFNIDEELIVNAYDVKTLTCNYDLYEPVGKLTSTSVAVMQDDGTLGGQLLTRYCYDDYGRVSATETANYEGGLDLYRNTYDIADNVLQAIRAHNSGEIGVTENFTYDHGGRQTYQGHQIASTYFNSPGEVALAVNTYNTKDQLVGKVMGGMAGMYYRYNSRGWLTNINGMPFSGTVGTPSCDFPQPPVDNPPSCAECGDDLLTLAQILQIRFDHDLKVDCYIPCDCDARCNYDEIDPCVPEEVPGGETGTPTGEGLNYPTNLFLIKDCTGVEGGILQDDLPSLTETYNVKGRVEIQREEQQFKVETPDSTQIVDVNGLLTIVNEGGDFTVKSYKKPPCTNCDPIPPACTSQAASDQQTSLANIAANLIQNIIQLQLPTNLVRVRLCSGIEVYLFEEELEDLSGNYMRLQEIPITEEDQELAIGSTNPYTTSLSYYLTIRDINTGWVINYYLPCDQNECSTVDERTSAHSINESTIFSTYDGQSPYQDLTAGFPDAENSLIKDGALWEIDATSPNWEAEWDVKVTLPPDADLLRYEVHVIIPEMGVNICRIGLFDGTQMVPINGGLDFMTLDGATFNQMPFLVLEPDALPSLAQIKEMKVAIFVGNKAIKIDAVYVKLDYTEPCDRCQLNGLNCTPEETIAQLASLENIKVIAAQTPLSEIPIPTKLYRVKLCDGSEVYLLHHELALLVGDYVILQSVSVSNLTQTFISDATPVSGGGNDPIARYDLFAMELKYYSGDYRLFATKGFGNGNIAAQYWQVAGRDRQAYGYRYDDLDRLKGSYYAEINKSGNYSGLLTVSESERG